MAMITVTWANGINSGSNPPGYQLNMALGVLALVVALLGAGRFSLDALVERRMRRAIVMVTGTHALSEQRHGDLTDLEDRSTRGSVFGAGASSNGIPFAAGGADSSGSR